VTVVTADGKETKGFIMNEDRFSVQMMDTSEDPPAGKRQAALFQEEPCR
jgi:hypothetical protein